MSPHELNFLKEKLSLAHNYLEFGAGFSTLMACDIPNIKIVSFETDVN